MVGSYAAAEQHFASAEKQQGSIDAKWLKRSGREQRYPC